MTAQDNSINYSVADVWAAAAAAFRINQNLYIKEIEYSFDENGVQSVKFQPNRSIVFALLADTTQLTPADYQRGEDCRNWVIGDIMLKAIKNKLTNFDASVQKVIAVEDVFNSRKHKLELSVIPCLLSSQARGVTRSNAEEKLRLADGIIGKIGDKVDLTIEVLNTNYSYKYNIWFVTAIDQDNHSLFFSYRKTIPVGSSVKIRGTVKYHKDSTTQLNRVKVL